MAKSKKSAKPKTPKPSNSFSFTNIPQYYKYIAALTAAFIIILIYFFPMVFEGKIPPATDTIAWKGNAQSILEAKEKYGYTPLWANNVFGGQPAQLISIQPPYEQPAITAIRAISSVLTWRVVYYFIGFAGMLLLMRLWGNSFLISIFTSLGFIWWPHLVGLIEAGHNTKVKTMMMIPLILYGLIKVLRKPTLLNTGLFALFLSVGVLAGHYQIIYYSAFLMLFLTVYYLYEFVKTKDWKSVGTRTGLLLVAALLAFGISSYRVLLVQEYSKYSIRGSTGEEGSTGLDFDYATKWSLAPAEIMDLVSPRFHGGNSAEVYNGSDVPQLKGKRIPGYWGQMPFTSSTEYMGVVIVFLSFFSLAGFRKNPLIMILAGTALLSLFLAMGRHFPFFYNLFFEYMPFFNKFRVPSMILFLVQLSLVIMAGFGLQYLLKEESKDHLKFSAYILGGFTALTLVPFLFKSSFSLIRPDEISRYQEGVVEMIKNARYDMMKQDTLRMFAFAAATFGLILAFTKKWVPRYVFGGLIIALLLLDMFSINNRFLKNLVPARNFDKFFVETAADQFLEKDQSLYRIFPIGELYDSSQWPYRHQSIGGYHPAKLRIIQDINENCLYAGRSDGFKNDPRLPVNWNIVNMLNVKYLLSKNNLQHENLEFAFMDKYNKVNIFRNNAALPRAFFVNNVLVETDRNNRFKLLNDPGFDPAQTAILEKEIPLETAAPDSWSVEITRYEPNFIDLDVSTDNTGLMVLSEIYYPAGWNVYVDGQKTEIFKTNHILRSVIVPAGNHKIEFRLEPKTYSAAMWMRSVAIILLYGLLVVEIIRYFRNRKQPVG